MLGHRVSVINFTKFCEAMPDRQEALVRQIRAQSLGTKKGGDYYGPLKYLLRRCHWATNDLAIFENGLADLLSRQTKTTKRDNYRRIGEAYIDYWRDRATEYFPVSSADVDIEGLTVSVKPEVGMRTKDGDRQILKLWFNRTSPTRTARRIIGHLLGQVNANPQWLPGIWDIKQRNIPLPVLPPDGFDLALAGQAAAFLRIWDELDQRAAAEI